MKILFVIDTFDTNNNGTSISAQRFADELKRQGHEVKILCADNEPSEDKFLVDEFVVHGFDNLIKKHGFQFASREADVVTEAVQ